MEREVAREVEREVEREAEGWREREEEEGGEGGGSSCVWLACMADSSERRETKCASHHARAAPAPPLAVAAANAANTFSRVRLSPCG